MLGLSNLRAEKGVWCYFVSFEFNTALLLSRFFYFYVLRVYLKNFRSF